MKRYLYCALLALIAAGVITGCVSRMMSTKPDAEGQQAPVAQESEESTAEEAGKEALPIPAPEEYAPPPPPDAATVQRAAVDLRNKDEIQDAALKFADNFKGILNVKICYSKLYGGWYLFLYGKKAEQIRVQQFSWDEKTGEWEVIYRDRMIPEDKLELDLKTEVDDETCFILR